MKIEVRFRNLEASELLRQYAVRRIQLQLSRFAAAVRSITVRLSDVNGPRGGDDKRCHIELSGPGLGSLAIDERSGNAYAAVDVAVERAARSARRELQRARAGRRLADDAGRWS